MKLIYRDRLKIFRKSTFTVLFTDALYLIDYQYWFESRSETIRIFVLVNALVIQSESLLKRNKAVTQNQFGKILITDLSTINASVSKLINDPRTGLFKRYKVNSIASFNGHFPSYLQEVETASNNDALKAGAIYFAYMLRNQVLHQFDDTFLYLQNNTDFEKVIGLLFTSLSVSQRRTTIAKHSSL